ncbi:serine carboxypeptidase-like 17 [Apium graveolens]|uniref:serine carboxypeptidase-like 17 n=1 Tax=Apium graveolens TaxID=4045 RepID=UPI003D7AE856
MTKLTITRVILILSTLQINLLELCFSQTVIKTLPGYSGVLPFRLETGYVGLGDEEDLQMFYYFVESERNPSDDPLMIWITGGPGCSSPRTFFYYTGPLKFDYANSYGKLPQLEVNPYSWTKVANVIFVDPPNSGFTYTKSKATYRNSDTLMAATIYEFLIMKWLENHPKFLNNQLYISGVSYSGISVPVMVQNIVNGNEAGNVPRLNIKGYMIGNPLTDRNIDFNARIPYAHQFALLSDELFEASKAHCNGEYIEVNRANGLCLKALAEIDKCLKDLYDQQILEPICIPNMITKTILQLWDGKSSTRNPTIPLPLSQQPPKSWCREDNYRYAIAWTTDRNVQKALHIREGTIEEWVMCNTDHYDIDRNDTDTYSYDIASSIVYHRNLTKNNCRALIYSGDHDLVFPYIGTRKWIRSLGLTVDRTWTPWFVKNQVAGYTETFSQGNYSMTFATVKGAGHTAPAFKPEESLAMVDRWLAQAKL